MSHWESKGKSDEWYTPKYIFDALGCRFDVDVAASQSPHACVPASEFIYEHSLSEIWDGFCWMNPPFGKRNSIGLWLDKMAEHGSGIALTPDRISAPWWQKAAKECTAILAINGKVPFVRPDGSIGRQPSNGTTLLGYGPLAYGALWTAQKRGLGILFKKA